MYKKITLIVIGLLAVTTTFAQTPGSLDPTFGTGGTVYNYIGTDTVNGQIAMAIQSDGKIVVGGSTYTANDTLPVIAVARYNTDGSLDTSFNHVGYVTTAFKSGFRVSLVGLTIQPDGKIVGVAEAPNLSYSNVFHVLVRYTANGVLDKTFGNGQGIIGSTFDGIEPVPAAIGLQANGKIITASSTYISGSDYITLARFDTTGLPDLSFGTNALTSLSFNSGADNISSPSALIVLSNQKILVVGYYLYGEYFGIGIVRYKSNGTLDSSFGNDDGIVVAALNVDSNSFSSSLAVQPDGKIIIGGAFGGTIATEHFLVARYDSSGSLDASFGNNGLAITPTIVSYVSSVLVQPDGKIVAAGYETLNSGFTANINALMRFKANGTPDSTFGTNGIVTSLFFGNDDGLNSIALQTDGKIVVAGSAIDTTVNHSYFTVARYISGLTLGIVQLSAIPTSVLVYPNPVHSIETLDYTLTNTETLTINLYDVTGRVIRNYMTGEKILSGEHKQQLNFENLAAGSYILTISNGEGKTESVKIVKQ